MYINFSGILPKIHTYVVFTQCQVQTWKVTQSTFSDSPKYLDAWYHEKMYPGN